jgi:hypothetical protein
MPFGTVLSWPRETEHKQVLEFSIHLKVLVFPLFPHSDIALDEVCLKGELAELSGSER